MSTELLEVFTERTLVITDQVAPTLQIIDTVSQIQTLELGLIGPQGPKGDAGPVGPTGPTTLLSSDPGNLLKFGTDSGLYAAPQMVYTNPVW
jgi:hypothetical protein